MARARLLGFRTRQAWLALAVAGAVSVGCSEDGTTANCPELPLYSIYEPGDFDEAGAHTDSGIEQARQEAIAEGCLTEIGYATSAGGSAGADGGGAGTGGASGNAGSD